MVTRTTSLEALYAYHGSLLTLGQTYAVSAFSELPETVLTLEDDDADHVIDPNEDVNLGGQSVDAVYSGTSTVGVSLLGIQVNLSSSTPVSVYTANGFSYVNYTDGSQAELLDDLASQILDTAGLSGVLNLLGLNDANSLVDYLESNAVLTFDLEAGADFPVCFAQGTRIITRKGALRIEDLRVGDKVLTRDNGYKAIRWIGQSSVAAYGKFAPILFHPGALGNQSDLLLSAEHRVLVSGWECELLSGETEALIAAKHLLDNPLVERRVGGLITYFHILFDRHEIIFANGVPCESFYPNAMAMQALDRCSFDEIVSLFPELHPLQREVPVAARKILRKHEARLVAQKVLGFSTKA